MCVYIYNPLIKPIFSGGVLWSLPTYSGFQAPERSSTEGWNYFDRLWPLWEWAVRAIGFQGKDATLPPLFDGF